MSARDDAIEAGAKAAWARDYAESEGPWPPRHPHWLEEARDEAAFYLDAMAPLIRQAVAEEIAQRIHWRFDHLVAPEHKSMRVVAEWCEREAREIGGAA